MLHQIKFHIWKLYVKNLGPAATGKNMLFTLQQELQALLLSSVDLLTHCIYLVKHLMRLVMLLLIWGSICRLRVSGSRVLHGGLRRNNLYHLKRQNCLVALEINNG